MKKLMLITFAAILIPSALAMTTPSVEELTNQGVSLQTDYDLIGSSGSDTLFEASVSFMPIPEPCTLLLCGGGAAFLFGAVRRK